VAIVNTALYCQGMTNRLTKENWLHHGLETLAANGANALKADPMAKALKVSRGSFYWHFRDIGDFHAGVIGLWQHRATTRVIEVTQDHDGDRLSQLIKRTFNADNRLERAIRAWAAQNSEVAKVVATVDDQRVQYLTELLQAIGVSQAKARLRAKFLYWAYLGQTLAMGAGQSSLSDVDINDISTLLQALVSD
jgi:AcrR family transcriptional regulator